MPFAYDGFIFDLDGTLTRGEDLVPGVASMFDMVLTADKSIVMLTNNTARPRTEICRTLARCQIDIAAHRIVTSAYATARYLYETRGPCPVFLIGEAAFAAELSNFGHLIVDADEAQVLVTGFDGKLSYGKLACGLQVLERQGLFVASDEDATWLSDEGIMPAAGCVVGAFRGMGYVPNLVVGKPNVVAANMAMSLLQTDRRDRILLVGDSLAGDIQTANRLGIDSALVLTGVTIREDVASSPIQPTYVIDSISDLADVILT